MSETPTNPDNKMESLSPPEIPTPTLQTFKISPSNDIDTALAQLVNLSEKYTLHEPTCLICSHPERKEIEKKWVEADKTEGHKEVKNFIKGKCNFSVSDDVIDNHMLHHYNRGIKELQKVEYIDRIKRLNAVELTTMDRIGLCFSALIERLTSINSITPDSQLSQAEVEKIKSAETSRLMASFGQLLKLQASILGEMKNSGELITIPRQAFVEIFNQTLAESKDEGQKAIVRSILSRLTELSKMTQ